MWQWVVAGLMVIAAPTDQAPEPRVFRIELESQKAFLRSTAHEKIVSSSVGEGKTFMLCLDGYLKCSQIPGLHAALTRLERVSMTETTVATLRDEIADPELWHWGWRASESKLVFPNGSELAVFGWLDPGRMLSAKFGWCGVDQAEQLARTHFATMKTRMRQRIVFPAGVEPFPPQIAMVCNPGPPTHWINKRYSISTQGAGVRHVEVSPGVHQNFEVILSRPGSAVIYNGADYYAGLETLKGTVEYDRLVGGLWASAEGAVFPMWDGSHVVDRPEGWATWGGYPPPTWERYRGFDGGIRNPFACLTWAKSPEGVYYRYRERYMTGRVPEEHAADILADEKLELETLRANCPADQAQALRPYLAQLNIADSLYDPAWAEGAASLQRHGVWCRPGKNDINGGIAIVCALLNQRRLLWVRGALVEQDPTLKARELPTCSEEEMPGYVRRKPSEAVNAGDEQNELPVDRDNHGIKTLTYVFLTTVSLRDVGVFG